jgi:hypothetical protein
MKMADITLQMARDLTEFYAGSVTGSSTTSITDSAMQFQQGLFNNGTVWITSGTYAGAMRKITSFGNGVINWSTALAGAPAVGSSFLATDSKFPLHLLRQAVNAILQDYPLEKQDTTLVVDTDNFGEYTLPAGVDDVYQVEIATESSSPYGWEKNHHWREHNGTLEIYDGILLNDDGKKIRLTYKGKHGEVDDSTAFQAAVDAQFVRYAAEAWLWRNYVLKMKKDDPMAVDMLNEAKFLEAERKSVRLNPYKIISRAIRLAGY